MIISRLFGWLLNVKDEVSVISTQAAKMEATASIGVAFKDINDAKKTEAFIGKLIKEGKLPEIEEKLKHEDQDVEAAMKNLYNVIRTLSVQIMMLKKVLRDLHKDTELMKKMGLNDGEYAKLRKEVNNDDELVNKYVEEMVQRIVGTR